MLTLYFSADRGVFRQSKWHSYKKRSNKVHSGKRWVGPTTEDLGQSSPGRASAPCAKAESRSRPGSFAACHPLSPPFPICLYLYHKGPKSPPKKIQQPRTFTRRHVTPKVNVVNVYTCYVNGILLCFYTFYIILFHCLIHRSAVYSTVFPLSLLSL